MTYEQALAEYYRTAEILYSFTKDMLRACSPSYPHREALEAAKAAHNAAWDALREAKREQQA